MSLTRLTIIFLLGTALSFETSAAELDRKLFFDADDSSFNFKTTEQKFIGNVVMIGGGVVIAADKIDVNAKARTVDARGHVVFLTKDQILLGEHVTYQQDKENVVVENGSLTINGELDIKKAVDKILGFSAEEMDFEAKRAEEIAESFKKIQVLAEEYGALSDEKKAAWRSSYTGKLRVLLERHDLATNQPNQVMNRKADRIQESLARRRSYWQENHVGQTFGSQNMAELGYFHLSGERLEKIDADDFYTQQSFFTSCYCEEGESPAWGFWSSATKVHLDGYADFWNPILKIKGIPVFYLPYLRIPVKTTRQSGLLLPNVTWSEYTGNTFTQPIFFNLGPNKDATLTEKLLVKRGLLHDLEVRYQQKKYSGWEFGAGVIDDRVWREDLDNRDTLRADYLDGLANARANPAAPSDGQIGDGRAGARVRLSEPDYWRDNGKEACLTGTAEQYEKCQRDIKFYTNAPRHKWRGFVNWRGLNYITDRLSLVSRGDINSDHRYQLDFESGYDLLQGDLQQLYAKAYSRVGALVHFDQTNYYLGAGSTYGDYAKLDDTFMGRQMPFYGKIRSRYFNILPKTTYFPIPFYASASVDYRLIQELGTRQYSPINPISKTLGDGNWSRFAVDVVTPLYSGWIFQIDQFTEVESRLISTANLDDNESGKTSMRTGLNVRLPIDGTFQIPNLLMSKKFNEDGKQRFIHHLMSWDLGFSYRPFIESWGPYASEEDVFDPDGYGLSYFPTDRPRIISQTESGVIDEDVFVKHQRLTMGTKHVFRVFDNVERDPVENYAQVMADGTLSYDQRADRILDLPENSAASVRAGRMSLPYSIPLTLGATIDYDFLDAQKRNDLKDSGNPDKEPLPEPWKELETEASLSTQGFVFNFRNSYNFYREFSVRNLLGMTLPTFWDTKLAFSYLVEKDRVLESTDAQAFVDFVRTTSVNVETEIIPNIKATIYSAQRKIEQTGLEERSEYLTRYGLTYTSPSKCWGLNLARVKNFHDEENQADYMLRFEVTFAGHSRELPNMGDKLLPKLLENR